MRKLLSMSVKMKKTSRGTLAVFIFASFAFSYYWGHPNHVGKLLQSLVMLSILAMIHWVALQMYLHN
jgi:hypothetical protein